jgi:DNA replication protein DnaC
MSIAIYFETRTKTMENDNSETLTKIKSHLQILKLYKIEKALDEQLAQASREGLPVSKVIERLLAIEANALIERRVERRIKESKLPERKLLADFDFEFQSGVDKGQIVELATLSFVKRKQGLILAGSSGTGKSHIAKALLLIGCQKLYRCRYTTAAQMLKDLMAGLSDDSLDQRLKAYTRAEILLIDEIGFDRLEQESSRNASLFFKVIDARYCKASTLLTSNIDFKSLGDYLGDPVITTAIVDRMVHHSIIINIDGPSWRIHESKKLNKSSTKAQEPTKTTYSVNAKEAQNGKDTRS